jgi:CBS domain-containing protein
MGEQDISDGRDPEASRRFTRALIADLRALEMMIERDMIERGERRAGVEQEMFVVDATCRPAPVAPEILARLARPEFTPELARFNLEANLPPCPLRGAFLGEIEASLLRLVRAADDAAGPLGARMVLTGILPTLRRSDLGPSNITPEERYYQLDRALRRLRGDSFSIVIRGRDVLELSEPTVMLESANTSFQLHMQVEPQEFAELYNLAQLITAPLLACAVNSPMFLGRRLWRETRVALFERATDGRSQAERVRGQRLRVSFGNDWVQGSVLRMFQDDASRFPVLLTREVKRDPVEEVRAGRAPPLSALSLHNGTVWRWNRPCYGVSGGKPHLRIENRVLPSGPTVLDEVANAALFYGLMLQGRRAFTDFTKRLDFEDVRANFINAACHGLDAQMYWLDRQKVSARGLLGSELIAIAEQGLASVGVPEEHIERYLGVIRERVTSRRTGAIWMLEARREMGPQVSGYLCARRLTAAMVRHQHSGKPVHEWPTATNEPFTTGGEAHHTVADVMSTDLFTVRPDDTVDLATNLMEWHQIRHVPVEDDQGRLAGMVTHRALLRLHERVAGQIGLEPPTIVEIMDPEPTTTSPDTPVLDAMRQLLETETGALLVVSGDDLIGIVTARDFLKAMIVEQTEE